MKLLIDMNLSPRWVTYLESVGINAIHWTDLGASNASDSELMAVAQAQELIVLTHDLDFGAILAATHGNKPSVVQIRAENVTPDAIGKPVVDALRQMSDELERGALVSVDPARARLRILPLSSY